MMYHCSHSEIFIKTFFGTKMFIPGHVYTNMYIVSDRIKKYFKLQFVEIV